MPIINLKKAKNIKVSHPLMLGALILWGAVIAVVVLFYGSTLQGALGAMLFSLILYYVGFEYFKILLPGFTASSKNMLLMATITAISVLLMVLIKSMPGIPAVSAYLFPAAAAGILLTVLSSPAAAVGGILIISVIGSVLGSYSFNYFFVYAAGGLVAVFSSRDIRNRHDLNRCGLYILAANIFSIISVEMMNPSINFAIEVLGVNLAWGALNSLASVIIAGGMLPILESTFTITTNMKLLERGDFNNPLLKKLMLQAPGTYHHSLMVANLAENACEAIGANPLVARVGAYYHDIGKLTNPQYFIENQQGLDYKHEKLKPNISTLILKRHVKDGLALAEEYNLDMVIKDMITQHHGTSLIKFFYNKELNEGEDRDKLEKKEFKYPGPRPQSREAGVLMLADSVEAACRSLEEPTYSRIANLVVEVINTKFTEGQLNECDLTMAGLEKIQNNFTHTLSGIYHSRIEYPEDKEEKAVE